MFSSVVFTDLFIKSHTNLNDTEMLDQTIKWRWRNKALGRITGSRWLRILIIVPNFLYRFCVSEKRWNILISIKFLLIDTVKIDILQWTKNRISTFVNVITSIVKILQFAVKMACKMTFNDYCRFSPILWYFLRKTLQSLFSTCFSVSCNAWMNTKFVTCRLDIKIKSENEIILLTKSLKNFKNRKFIYRRF